MHGGADTGGQRLRVDARADDERHHASRQLRVRNVDHRKDVNVERRDLDVLDDADDLVRRTRITDEHVDAFAERVFAGKEAPRRGLAHDVTRGESSWSAGVTSRPATCGMPMVLKKPGVIGLTSVLGPFAGAGHWSIAAPVAGPHAAAPRHREKGDAGRLLDARERTDARERVREEAGSLRWRRVTNRRRLHARREHAVGVESRIDVLQAHEAANQETRADEQNQRQRHFRDDEPAENAPRPRPAAVAAAFAKRLIDRARRHDRRHEAEDQARGEGDGHRHGEHRQVERDLIESRHRYAIGNERDQPAVKRKRQRQPGDAARGAEQQALAEQLREETPASRTERGADAELALAHRASRQEQIRHVHARNQQHQKNGTSQDEERRSNRLDHLLVHGHEHRGPPGVEPGRLRLALRH